MLESSTGPFLAKSRRAINNGLTIGLLIPATLPALILLCSPLFPLICQVPMPSNNPSSTQGSSPNLCNITACPTIVEFSPVPANTVRLGGNQLPRTPTSLRVSVTPSEALPASDSQKTRRAVDKLMFHHLQNRTKLEAWQYQLLVENVQK